MSIIYKNMKFKGLTKKTRGLLAGDENYQVDFKLKSNQIDPEDFVSFANSKTGGTILFGVKEVHTNGLQKGEIVGCEVGDKQKQLILNKALSCSPAIDVLIFVENTKSKPIFRVEIPAGKKKPYSTSSGKYLARENGRNKALHPVDLLKLFIENETGEFIKRFNIVTKGINTKLQILNDNFLKKMIETTNIIIEKSEQRLNDVMDSLSDVTSEIDNLGDDINQSLKEIFDSASNAESLSDEAMLNSDEASYLSREISNRVEYIDNDLIEMNSRIKLLLNHFNLEDPLITRQKFYLKEMIKISLKENPRKKFYTIKKYLSNSKIYQNDQFLEIYGKECYNLAKQEVIEKSKP